MTTRRPQPRRRSATTDRTSDAAPRSAREVALAAMLRIDHDGAYANLVLPPMLERSTLTDQDRRFVTELVYGSTRMRRACDALIDRFVLSEPDPAVRTVLRLGAYQLAFAGTAPHAAVAETVSLAPMRARGFVNAVLRRVAATEMVWPDAATQLSYPDWIVERLRSELGEHEALAAMTTMNHPPPVSERADGYIQDRASQWVAAAVDAQPGDRVLDLCAAPGGKATAIAARAGLVVAADLQPQRARVIAANVDRLGVAVPVVISDGTAPPFAPATFDRVLIDAPCSGLGALRRRPDARWRIEPGDIDDLTALQGRLLDAGSALVRPGGVLVYSVCTITAAESVDHPIPDGFETITEMPDGPWRTIGRGFGLLPHDADTDGMILIRYRRRQ